jgi:hypothetical protein
MMKVMFKYEDVQSATDAYRVLTNECNRRGVARRATLASLGDKSD